jgi:hypothetical protein
LIVALVVVGRLGTRSLSTRGPGGDIKAGAALRLQIAHRNQAVIGLDHCETADFVRVGKLADRRQLGARPQTPIVDLLLNAGDNLLGERLAAILTDREGQHSQLAGIGPVT